MTLVELDDDSLAELLSWVDTPTRLCACRRVCRRMRDLLDSDGRPWDRFVLARTWRDSNSDSADQEEELRAGLLRVLHRHREHVRVLWLPQLDSELVGDLPVMPHVTALTVINYIPDTRSQRPDGILVLRGLALKLPSVTNLNVRAWPAASIEYPLSVPSIWEAWSGILSLRARWFSFIGLGRIGWPAFCTQVTSFSSFDRLTGFPSSELLEHLAHPGRHGLSGSAGGSEAEDSGLPVPQIKHLGVPFPISSGRDMDSLLSLVNLQTLKVDVDFNKCTAAFDLSALPCLIVLHFGVISSRGLPPRRATAIWSQFAESVPAELQVLGLRVGHSESMPGEVLHKLITKLTRLRALFVNEPCLRGLDPDTIVGEHLSSSTALRYFGVHWRGPRRALGEFHPQHWVDAFIRKAEDGLNSGCFPASLRMLYFLPRYPTDRFPSHEHFQDLLQILRERLSACLIPHDRPTEREKSLLHLIPDVQHNTFLLNYLSRC